MDLAMRGQIEAQAASIMKLASRSALPLAELREQTAALQALLAEAGRQQRVAETPRGTVVPLIRPRPASR